jgi:hypothetical protein
MEFRLRRNGLAMSADEIVHDDNVVPVGNELTDGV